MKRRIVLVLGVGAVLGGVGFWTAADTSRRKNHTDKEAVAKYFPALGPLMEVHWATSRDGEADGRSLLPSSDFAVTAVLRLKPAKVAALVADGGFDVVDTGVGNLSWFEKGLSDVLPAGAKWEHSDAFDEEVLSRFDGGQCYLDRATDTAFVRAVNPVGSGGPTTAASAAAGQPRFGPAPLIPARTGWIGSAGGGSSRHLT
ncbi:hypothetical protein [Streptomyces colonosanans]|uniref:Uncharacterized protein n=1 Tax=Streptomyces colonosanans TaxID=1428652 RepID=A0A1S2Q5G3_9ACTN|nr:hypothetical protein [Streptomyces colonosanans]OIK00993.1 hypothetical protein BIV24_01820 [Streptomyces colonosanans]